VYCRLLTRAELRCRFHYTGALELSLMVLDLYDHTQDLADLERYAPMAITPAIYRCL
jgi:hypothetical protein